MPKEEHLKQWSSSIKNMPIDRKNMQRAAGVSGKDLPATIEVCLPDVMIHGIVIGEGMDMRDGSSLDITIEGIDIHGETGT